MSILPENTKRFEGRASDYSKYRPRYPKELMTRLEGAIGLGESLIIADIGSGTGILSELFLEHGNRVYCVEPNKEMRSQAERALARFGERFISVDGTAEKTTIEPKSVDVVAAGQALHWFDPEKSRAEFRRILNDQGHFVVVYNHRNEEDPVSKAYASLVSRFGRDHADVPDVDDAYIESFFGSRFVRIDIPNSQILDEDGVRGRLASASYMPLTSDPVWKEIDHEISSMVKSLGSGGTVTVKYLTTCYAGRMH